VKLSESAQKRGSGKGQNRAKKGWRKQREEMGMEEQQSRDGLGGEGRSRREVTCGAC
jgi:hypothetical protein